MIAIIAWQEAGAIVRALSALPIRRVELSSTYRIPHKYILEVLAMHTTTLASTRVCIVISYNTRLLVIVYSLVYELVILLASK